MTPISHSTSFRRFALAVALVAAGTGCGGAVNPRADQFDDTDAGGSPDAGVDAAMTDSGFEDADMDAAVIDGGPLDAGDGATPVAFAVSGTSPGPQGSLGDAAAELRVTFSSAPKGASINDRSFLVLHEGSQVEGNLAVEGDEVAFVPLQPWTLGASYTLTIASSVTDGVRRLEQPFELPFFGPEGSWQPPVLAGGGAGTMHSVAVWLARDGSGLVAGSGRHSSGPPGATVWAQPFSPKAALGEPRELVSGVLEGVSHVLLAGNFKGAATVSAFVTGHSLGVSRGWLASGTEWLPIPWEVDGWNWSGATAVAADGHTFALWSLLPSSGDAPVLVEYSCSPGSPTPSCSSRQVTSDPSVLVTVNGLVAFAGGSLGIWSEQGKLWSSLSPGTPLVDGVEAAAAHARIAADARGESAIVVWTHADAKSTHVRAARAAPYLGFGSPATLSDLDATAGWPALAMDGEGRALAVWRQNAGSGYRIMAATYDGAQEWSQPIQVADSQGDEVGAPAIAMAPTGDALVGWVQTDADDATKADVWVARFFAGRGFQHDLVQVVSAGHGMDGATLQPAIDERGRGLVAWIETVDGVGQPKVARLE